MSESLYDLAADPGVQRRLAAMRPSPAPVISRDPPDKVGRLRAGEPEMAAIADQVLGETRFTLAQVRSASRKQPLVQVRWKLIRALHAGGFDLLRVSRFVDRNRTLLIHVMGRSQLRWARIRAERRRKARMGMTYRKSKS